MNKKHTDKYIRPIVEHIISTLQTTDFPRELNISLRLLEDTFDLYLKVSERLKEEELINDRGYKNPLIGVFKDLTTSLTNQIKQIVISLPFTQIKNQDNEKEMNPDQLIALLKG